MDFQNVDNLTLGDIVEGDSRMAVWTFRVDTLGSKTISFRAWSENGGELTTTANLSSLVTSPGIFDWSWWFKYPFIIPAIIFVILISYAFFPRQNQ